MPKTITQLLESRIVIGDSGFHSNVSVWGNAGAN